MQTTKTYSQGLSCENRGPWTYVALVLNCSNNRIRCSYRR